MSVVAAPQLPTEVSPDGAKGAARRGSRRDARFALWWWALPAIFCLIVFHYVASGAGSFYAFTEWGGLGDFTFVGFDNFAEIFTTEESRKGLINTIIIAVGYLVFSIVFGLLLALALNRTLKTRYFLRVVLFAPVVLSPLAVSYIWKFIYQLEGPLNRLLGAVGLESWQRTWLGDKNVVLAAILLVMVWQSVGLAMVMFLAGLASVPEEIEEAAAIDGAGVFSRFRHVTLPLIRPSIVIVATLTLIQGLRAFDQVLALTGGGPFGASETLASLVYKESFVNGRFGYGAALSVLLTVLIAICAVLQTFLLRRGED
jgi:raffinose/stachyose/melibiose transport system permease protein